MNLLWRVSSKRAGIRVSTSINKLRVMPFAGISYTVADSGCVGHTADSDLCRTVDSFLDSRIFRG